MSTLINDANDNVTQEESVEQNGSRSSQTWHRILLQPSPSSSQLSYISEMPTDVGSQSSTPRQTRLGIPDELDESATNYDSGNFSLFEPGSKERLASHPGCPSGEWHQRFLQLNTELYQTKTELLAYKYKWNEIRNEIELTWTKKHDKLTDEKNQLASELEALRSEIARAKENPTQSTRRELLRIRSELQDITVRLQCKEEANELLKEKIAEQHVEKEVLSLRIRNLEKLDCKEHSEMCRVKASERWFREELHRCQNENAKLKESYAMLDNLLCKERTDRVALIEGVQGKNRQVLLENNKLLSIIQTNNASNECAKKENEHRTKQLEQENALLKQAQYREAALLENLSLLEKQNIDLHAVLGQLQQTLEDHQTHAKSAKEKEKRFLQQITRAQEETNSKNDDGTIGRYRLEIETLSAQLAKEYFSKRQIDVSVEKLKAQVKVLSINLATRTCEWSDAEKCELSTVRQRNRDLQEQCNRLVNETQRLERDLAMCSERAKQHYDQLLMQNIRGIQSKNLNLEMKLGHRVDDKEVVCEKKRDEMTWHNAKPVWKLKKGNTDPTQKVIQQQLEKDKDSKKSVSLPPKHGSNCRRNVTKLTLAENEDDEMQNLRIMLKAIESVNRRRLQRYEINNRTLLKKVKEHARECNQVKQQMDVLEKEHQHCVKLRCEMASARERSLLLEADLYAARQEADTLTAEKNRLLSLLQSNCVLSTDGDIWRSLTRIFKDLQNQQQMQKENKRLQQQLAIDSKKIDQLEASIGDWKLAFDVQMADTDELRSAFTLQTLQLKDSQRTMDRLVTENSSLQQSALIADANEKNLTEQLSKLNRLVRIQEIRLDTAHKRVKLYEESESMLAASQDKFYNDLQSLQDAILVEKQEKYELGEEVRELRKCMVNAVGKSFQNFHPISDSNDGETGQHSTTTVSSDPQPLSLSPASLDIDHLRELVEESSRKTYSLQPLHDCVSSLKQEMDHLNSFLHLGNYSLNQQQQHHHQLRFPLSLMDELNDATNGHYGSR